MVTLFIARGHGVGLDKDINEVQLRENAAVETTCQGSNRSVSSDFPIYYFISYTVNSVLFNTLSYKLG